MFEAWTIQTDAQKLAAVPDLELYEQRFLVLESQRCYSMSLWRPGYFLHLLLPSCSYSRSVWSAIVVTIDTLAYYLNLTYLRHQVVLRSFFSSNWPLLVAFCEFPGEERRSSGKYSFMDVVLAHFIAVSVSGLNSGEEAVVE